MHTHQARRVCQSWFGLTDFVSFLEDDEARAAPDLAVEVISPSNRPGDIRAKVADYLAAGTRLVWVVDPDPARLTITAYETLLSPRVYGADDEIDGSTVLPGLRCRVRDLM